MIFKSGFQKNCFAIRCFCVEMTHSLKLKHSIYDHNATCSGLHYLLTAFLSNFASEEESLISSLSINQRPRL